MWIKFFLRNICSIKFKLIIKRININVKVIFKSTENKYFKIHSLRDDPFNFFHVKAGLNKNTNSLKKSFKSIIKYEQSRRQSFMHVIYSYGNSQFATR